ncbi:McKusick-Kaufman/Bardet-Biedl syndromes putative chaperonin [Dunckerocampus dactyliophorus]|uniref:McKusick-Kaufman/Bardet-Biedl syndromes putative chaperonin n=1 Tax=Dunckerocampus dactyliophorus TaxID=161453 RepID=UPI002407267D|nr:McKusick-Kaufman/Bardet-Biedl syndromes putative chaperonin [Dunckerocampus dactyliophorus]
MSRLVKKSPALCTDLPLETSDILGKIHLLGQLLRSCFGPSGRLKHVHNNIGGQVVTTSTSSLLLPSISSSRPFLNLILASIHNHVRRFSDCGLFAAIVCVTLIERAEQFGLRRKVTTVVNKHLLGLCTNYLQQEACGCKVNLDFCSSHNLITLARSVLCSKPACMLTGREALHISKLAVQSFLLTVPSNSNDIVTLGMTLIVTIDGLPVNDSAVFPGLLLDVPDGYEGLDTRNPPSNPLCMVLFSTSLAGDLSELGDGTIEVQSIADTDSDILNQLLEIGRQVVKDGVKLFVCQRVIHPVLQQNLRSHGVIVIERVGLNLMQPLTQLTGSQPVATLHTTIPPKAYGKVGNIISRQFGSKTMLQVHPAGESVICTTVLCHRNATMLNELKVAYHKTEHVLRLTLKEPFALLGGGCTETHLAAYIRHQCDTTGSASMLDCSQTEYCLGVEAFCSSLESVATSLQHDSETSLIDLISAHHWTLPVDTLQEDTEACLNNCGCGLMKSSQTHKWSHLNTKYPVFSPVSPSRGDNVKPSVLDSFTAKLNALQVAVETANVALDVRYIIQDTN